jgi:type II secretory pathway component GspD/PulD (secretin)
MTGVLTDPQFRWVIQALQQRDGAELLGQPEVTTTSGRQAQMKMVTTQRVLTGINERALTPPGITTTNGDEGPLYVTESLETGQTLDVTASVLEDGYTIALTVIPRITEFLGYVEGQTNRVAVYVNGGKKWVTPPRPDVRVLQGHTTLRVWDGRTLNLGGLLSEKKNVDVFVTPTLIDPAGNRVHSEAEMAFPRYGIPPPQAPQ